MRKIIFIALAVIATGAGAFMLLYQPKRIDIIFFSQDYYLNWPIMQVSIKANDNLLAFPNKLVRGASSSLPTKDLKHLNISAEWVEMLPNSGWRAELTDLIDIIPLRDMGRNEFTADIMVKYGRNGQLQLLAWDGTVLAEICGVRAPELDKDYRDQIPLDQRFEWAYEIEDGPPPKTPCLGPEE